MADIGISHNVVLLIIGHILRSIDIAFLAYQLIMSTKVGTANMYQQQRHPGTIERPHEVFLSPTLLYTLSNSLCINFCVSIHCRGSHVQGYMAELFSRI